jgi:NAD(P)-dependent dehydrogenase (short-subunit alcohol dehydrogenase family)
MTSAQGFPGLATVSLVTGANRGIGRDVCRQLAARGHAVVLTARSARAAESAGREVGAEPLRLDVSDVGPMNPSCRRSDRPGDGAANRGRP